MRQIILLAISGLFSIYSSLHAQESISKWQGQPIIIDGNLSDWESIPRFFDSESNVQYEFRNDAQNLYLTVRTSDQATQIQLRQAGFSVHLKLKSKPPTKFGITFTTPKKRGMPPMDRNPEDKRDKLVDKFSSKPEVAAIDSAILDGFLLSESIITSENKDPKGICFAKSKASRDQFVVEFQIPLKEMYGNDFSLSNLIGIPIQFQMIINELSETANKSRGRMNGGMRGGEMRGGMPTGEMGRGGMPGGGEEMGGGEMPESLAFSRKSFTANFKLSAGK
jgi:hypothetical protein